MTESLTAGFVYEVDASYKVLKQQTGKHCKAVRSVFNVNNFYFQTNVLQTLERSLVKIRQIS